MDKKNFLWGITCLVLAFGFMWWESTQQLKQTPSVTKPEISAPAPKAPSNNQAPEPAAPSIVAATQTVAPSKVVAPEEGKEKLLSLENAYVRVVFTNMGGSIRTVALKHYPQSVEHKVPFVFNAGNEEPALAMGFKGKDTINVYRTPFAVRAYGMRHIEFVYKTPEGIELVRSYSLAEDTAENPYEIAHETRFINTTAAAMDLQPVYWALGSYLPTEGGDAYSEYLNFGYYNGEDATFIKTNDFKGSNGFLGIGRHAPVNVVEKTGRVVWASVKNQFFATILTPREPGLETYSVCRELKHNGKAEESVTGYLGLKVPTLSPGQPQTLKASFYVGPKEYTRLNRMEQHQDLVMQFGFFEKITKLLLILMLGVHSIIPNWGLAIIAVTVLIKLLLWPLTAAQVRSAKRMALIQQPLQVLREKYKNNPQKMQSETMKLFKENKVNPAAGCLPLFVQLPIFLGLYFMLRTASELRLQPFLWAQDLSASDTIAHIAGMPLNPLPLLMGITMYIQMKLSPTPSTSGAQQKMLQFMPFIFLIFCYNFPSGLVLYWTVQNLLTILQQWLMNRKEGTPVAAKQ